MPKQKLGPPKNVEDFSSNWKKLQATLQPKTKKRKAEVPEREHKRRKLGGSVESKKPTTKPVNGQHSGQRAGRMEAAKRTETNQAAEKNEIWFDDVDELLLERPVGRQHDKDQDPLVMQNGVTHATKALAMDCEMVGVGNEGEESILARVSIVNQHGHCIYDKFVKPREKVTDFRTHVSGVRPENLRDAEDFLVVQKKVSELLKGKVLVGHALHNDLKVLFLDHPRRQIRDTSRYKPFRQLFGGRNPSLKKLTAKVLGVCVQEGEHSSVQDAQAAMRLYMMHRKRWERELAAHHKGKKKQAAGKASKKKKRTAEGKKVTFADNS
ncbi:RNA exonuclease 4-like [Babylonia areolata]|uniref:RNA exonuclease 4-like n=1 Tax=Babylonia areolata TaxID=304850 RepID=UPI003FD4DDBE